MLGLLHGLIFFLPPGELVIVVLPARPAIRSFNC